MKNLVVTFNHEEEDIRKAVLVNGTPLLLKEIEKKEISEELVESTVRFLMTSNEKHKGIGPMVIMKELLESDFEGEELAMRAFIAGHTMADDAPGLAMNVFSQIRQAKEKETSRIVETTRDHSIEYLKTIYPEKLSEERKEMADLMAIIMFGCLMYVVSNMQKVMLNSLMEKMGGGESNPLEELMKRMGRDLK
jgi:hypothetical protein